MQAAKLTGDAVGPGPGKIIGPGVPNVMIDKMLVSVSDDQILYTPPLPASPIVVPIEKGSSKVLINGKPAARVTDLAGPGSIIVGAATVIIGG